MTEQIAASRRGRPRLPSKQDKSGSSPVVALDRGIRVLIYLAESRAASLAEISKDTAIPAATAHRILSTLQHRGMVAHDADHGKWRIGPQAYRIGNAFEEGSNLLEVAPAVMRMLSKETGETANLAVEDGGKLLYLVQVESENPIRASIKNGTDAYFHTSGVGKTIMAFMEDDELDRFLEPLSLMRQTSNSITDKQQLKTELKKSRQRGWALDDEERSLGMRCIAAPVFDSLGNLVAGVSISGPITRFPNDKLDALAMSVIRAANEISKRLSNTPAVN